MREKWTDERLDDMNARISEGFERMDREFRDVRAEFRDVRTEVRDLRSDMGTEFGSVRAEMSSRFDATQQLILRVSAGMFVTMLVGFLGVITQL